MKNKIRTLLYFFTSIVVVCINYNQQLYAMEAATTTIKSTSHINQAELDTTAITQGYGYKYANLCVLEKLCIQLNKQPNQKYLIKVPPFGGISSPSAQNFLASYSQFNLATEWITITLKQQINKEKILTNKQFPKNYLDGCKAIEDKIINSFDALITKITTNEHAAKPPFSFNNFFKTTDDIDSLIKKTKKNNKRLMVRSSGKEDSKTVTNAGGNVTIANVKPNTIAILAAMSKVIASCFEKKSLQQRLGEGDSSLFELTTPLTPVIIQEMIDNPDEATTSGVMFTEEAEGGIAKNEIPDLDNNGIQTTGITNIQSAYGHNEGVVNSIIPVDTYYIDSTNNIFPVIRPKTIKIIPDKQSGELIQKSNDPRMINTSSLNTDALKQLKALATLLENYYQCPMDVEFVIDNQKNAENNGKEGTIYLVQARPLTYDQTLVQPAYIVNGDNIGATQKITGNVVSSAGGALRTGDKKNIIITGTINQALEQYEQTIDKSAIHCIIIGTMAASTSHGATYFRRQGKPIIYSQQWQTVEKWLTDPTTQLLISPQQGLIINNKNIANIVTANGWITYPIERFVSLSEQFKPTEQLTIETIQALLPDIVDESILMEYFSNQNKSLSWKECLNKIKKGSENEASIALALLLYDLHKIITNISTDVVLDADLKNKIDLLQSYALYFAQCIKKNLQYSPTDQQYAKRLFAIHFLESLLFQQPTPGAIVNGYSVATVIAKELITEQEIIKKLSAQEATKDIASDPMTIQYMKIEDLAMTPKLEDEWLQFITQLAQKESPKGKNEFATLIVKNAFYILIFKLGKLDMLPVWLNTSFANSYEQFPSTENMEKLIIELYSEYDSQHDFLEQLADKKNIMTTSNKDLFDDPTKFEFQWNKLKQELIYYFLGDIFLNSFNNANNLGKCAALNIMINFVDIFDLSIKALTGSQLYKNNETKQVDNFKMMIKEYAQLLERWNLLIPKEGDMEILKRFNTHASKIIKTILSNTNSDDSSQLKATPDFDVSLYTKGWNRLTIYVNNEPQTCEDAFTTVHQCLIRTIQELRTPTDLSVSIALPELLQKIDFQIKAIKIPSTFDLFASFVGINFANKSITLTYNLPFVQHSLQLEVFYKKNSPDALLTLHFFGTNPEDRWNKISLLIKALIKSNFLTTIIKSESISNNGFELQLLINQTANTKELWAFIQNIGEYTLARNPRCIEQYAPYLAATIDTIATTPSEKMYCLEMLIQTKNSDGFTKAFQIAQEYLQSEDVATKKIALMLLFQLVSQQYDINSTIPNLFTMLSEPDEIIKGLADDTIQKLIRVSNSDKKMLLKNTLTLTDMQKKLIYLNLLVFVGYTDSFTTAYNIAQENIKKGFWAVLSNNIINNLKRKKYFPPSNVQLPTIATVIPSQSTQVKQPAVMTIPATKTPQTIIQPVKTVVSEGTKPTSSVEQLKQSSETIKSEEEPEKKIKATSYLTPLMNFAAKMKNGFFDIISSIKDGFFWLFGIKTS